MLSLDLNQLTDAKTNSLAKHTCTHTLTLSLLSLTHPLRDVY